MAAGSVSAKPRACPDLIRLPYIFEKNRVDPGAEHEADSSQSPRADVGRGSLGGVIFAASKLADSAAFGCRESFLPGHQPLPAVIDHRAVEDVPRVFTGFFEKENSVEVGRGSGGIWASRMLRSFRFPRVLHDDGIVDRFADSRVARKAVGSLELRATENNPTEC